MNQDINRLQELLARVQRNAALPRILNSAPLPLATASAAPAPPPRAETEVMPSYALPVPSYAQAPLDASVDELLLEDPFPSAPPPPPPPAAEQPEQPAEPALPQTLHNEISGVTTVSALSESAPEELLEDDIIEVTPGTAAAAPGPSYALDELNFDDDEDLAPARSVQIEEPPISSSRQVPGTMDEALARAADQIDSEEEREVPLKTPPPESGPQEAMNLPAGMHAPLAPDIEALLESDAPPPRTFTQPAVPTPEQLGQTLDLDDARGPTLELDHPPGVAAAEPNAPVPPEELEVTLPQREYGGGYQADLLPPPEAREELDAHRQRFGEAPAPEPIAQPAELRSESATSGFAEAAAASVTTNSFSEGVSTVTVEAPPHAEFAPELLARPEVSPVPIAKFIHAAAPRPNTFLELLDRSLSLGSD